MIQNSFSSSLKLYFIFLSVSVEGTVQACSICEMLCGPKRASNINVFRFGVTSCQVWCLENVCIPSGFLQATFSCPSGH